MSKEACTARTGQNTQWTAPGREEVRSEQRMGNCKSSAPGLSMSLEDAGTTTLLQRISRCRDQRQFEAACHGDTRAERRFGEASELRTFHPYACMTLAMIISEGRAGRCAGERTTRCTARVCSERFFVLTICRQMA